MEQFQLTLSQELLAKQFNDAADEMDRATAVYFLKELYKLMLTQQVGHSVDYKINSFVADLGD